MSKRKGLDDIRRNINTTSYTESSNYSGSEESVCDEVDNNISEESLFETSTQKSYNKESYNYKNNKKNKSKKTNDQYVWIIYTFVGLIATLLLYLLVANNFNEAKNIDKCAFNALNAEYPKNEHISIEVSSIATILKNGIATKAAVYLFLHNDTIEPEPFVNSLADSVLQCFESEDGKLMLNDFKACSHDYGCVIKEYVTNNKKVLLINLKKMPIEIVPSLHSICDTYDPIIAPAFTFLTLALSENYDDIKSAKNIANEELEKIWSAIDKNERIALIARVTDKVHFLHV